MFTPHLLPGEASACPSSCAGRMYSTQGHLAKNLAPLTPHKQELHWGVTALVPA